MTEIRGHDAETGGHDPPKYAGSAYPVGDGRNRYAYVTDFERWLANQSMRNTP